jgi:hypothetical protein
MTNMLMASAKLSVVLAKAGDPAALMQKTLDSRFRGNDEYVDGTGFPLARD